MKLLLICSGGMSTHILMASMEKEAKRLELADYSSDAIGANELEDYSKDFDIMLIAPQIKFKYATYEAYAKENNKKIYQIQPMEYTPVGAPKLVQHIIQIMEDK